MLTSNDQPTESVTVEALFEQAIPFLPRVVYIAFRRRNLFPTQDDVERCCERVLFKLWDEGDYKPLREFRQEATLETYLRTIAYYEVVDFLRENGRNVPLEDLPSEMIEQPPQQEDILLHKEYEQLREEGLKQLTAQDQNLYNLAYKEELSVEKIAQKLGCKPEAVWQRKSRLIERLRDFARKI
ncbi:MAG: sigma-70 family RNA polymerase sigma factor [Acidobacteria bacterium]|nr:sigma-70 family RNA polymerase sigma factor [Acidobacteriota bacterium]